MDNNKIFKKVIEIAKVYENKYLNKNLLIIYGKEDKINYFETLFERKHFLHLTGINYKTTKKEIYSKGYPSYSNEFFSKISSNRLKENELIIENAKNIEDKLNSLENLIPLYRSARIVGLHNGLGIELKTSKMVGGEHYFMGFDKDEEQKFYSPNTIIKGNINEFSEKPNYRLLAIFIKNKDEPKYKCLHFCNKNYIMPIQKYNKELLNKIDDDLLKKIEINNINNTNKILKDVDNLLNQENDDPSGGQIRTSKDKTPKIL